MSGPPGDGVATTQSGPGAGPVVGDAVTVVGKEVIVIDALGLGTAEARAAPARPNLAFLLRHPAHAIALGFGTGLSPWAPGTVGTLWGWLVFLLLWPRLSGAVAVASWLAAFGIGWWACTRAAQHLRTADPGAIVWDEILAIALVLAVVMPAGWKRQLLAFALFRFFDAVKPGPVGLADRWFKPRPGEAIGWRQGFGILVDDLVAAGCTLLVIALGVRLWD